MSYIDREDLYDGRHPEFAERTKNRLTQLSEMGMTEVGVAQFGVRGVMSGLYIERVWHFSDEEWDEYMKWAAGLINQKSENNA